MKNAAWVLVISFILPHILNIYNLKLVKTHGSYQVLTVMFMMKVCAGILLFGLVNSTGGNNPSNLLTSTVQNAMADMQTLDEKLGFIQIDDVNLRDLKTNQNYSIFENANLVPEVTFRQNKKNRAKNRDRENRHRETREIQEFDPHQFLQEVESVSAKNVARSHGQKLNITPSFEGDSGIRIEDYYRVLLMIYILFNRVLTEGVCKLLDLPLADLCDEDRVTRGRNTSAALSGTISLFSKPGQSIAALLGHFFLGGNHSPDRVLELMYGTPIFLGVVQCLFWSQYNLHKVYSL